jgi:hypothetical protein
MNAAASLVTKAMAVAVGGALMSGLSAAAQTTSLTLYAPAPLGAQATFPVANLYANAPVGSVTLGGIPFNVLNSAWIKSGTSASVTTNSPKPLSVYLLLNSAYGTLNYSGQTVGRVHLTFSDGSSQDTNLVAGGNIREWWTGSGLINTVSDPANTMVWQGQGQQAMQLAGPAHLDMLNVKIAATTANLTGVTVTSSAPSPYFMLLDGITVAYDPMSRPGNSGNTPAAQNSQAGDHAKSANFTGTDPAQSTKNAPAALATSTSTDTKTNDSDKHTNRGHH